MSGPRKLSIGRLALAVMGAAVIVLAIATAIVLVFKPAPVVALLVVLGGIVGAIAAMGATSKWMLRRADRAEDGLD